MHLDISELLISRREKFYIFYVNFIEFSSLKIQGASGFLSMFLGCKQSNKLSSNLGFISGGYTLGKGIESFSFSTFLGLIEI